MTCLLFTYGLLKPDYRPPKTMSAHWPDRVRGTLYDLGPYPGAVGIGQGDSWIEGVVVQLDDSELVLLDVFEGVEQGDYVRKRVRTQAGREVWIYEYNRPIPKGARPLAQWPSAQSAGAGNSTSS
jgi:gamma-glutamylcyclotransferase (GGCT)/AIG2-like uncharacterized protein YtfP